MKKVFKLANNLNVLSLFTILIMIFFGKDAFLITTDEDIVTVCTNQFIVAFIVTFITHIYAKVKNIPTIRSVYDIFENCESHIRIIVIVSVVICFTISCVYYKKFLTPYFILCVLHSTSILACSAILRQKV